MSGELPNPGPEDEVLDNPPLPPQPPPKTISEELQRDLLSAEFLAGLFWSAMNSFRHDSILRPFPSFFLEGRAEGAGTDGERTEGEELKDIEGLVCGWSPHCYTLDHNVVPTPGLYTVTFKHCSCSCSVKYLIPFLP